METKTEVNILEQITPKADKLSALDDEISKMNYTLKELKAEREKISDELVSEMEQHGIDTFIGLPNGSLLKMDTKVYPSVIDMDGFFGWAEENHVTLPVMQFNASTLAAWYKEQIENSQPVPPAEIVKQFIKTRVKINKGGR